MPLLRAGAAVPGEPRHTRPACLPSFPSPSSSALCLRLSSPPAFYPPFLAHLFPAHPLSPPVMNTLPMLTSAFHSPLSRPLPSSPNCSVGRFHSTCFCPPPPFTLYIRSRSCLPYPLLPSSSPARKIIIALTCQMNRLGAPPHTEPLQHNNQQQQSLPCNTSCNTPKPGSSAADQGPTREIQDPVRGVRGGH